MNQVVNLILGNEKIDNYIHLIVYVHMYKYMYGNSVS